MIVPAYQAAATIGLCLDASLDRGWTGSCDTYANEQLAGAEVFRALRVEVWGFVLPHESHAGGGAAGMLGISAMLGGSGARGDGGPRAWLQLR